MATIGVTRGFGDHDLVSVHQRIPIKPFLTCHPEVQVYDLKDVKRHDVLVMGTDGLWDVIDGSMVAHTVNEAVQIFEEKEVYISAATCLVGAARGSSKDQQWTLKSGKAASVDDISVFVVPLYQISKDFKNMLKAISLRLPIELPLQIFNENEYESLQNGAVHASWDEKEFRRNYLTSVVETIKEKQRTCKSSKHSDLCFVSTDKVANDTECYKCENALYVNVNGNLPKDDFVLINVQSIDSIDVVEDAVLNNLESVTLDDGTRTESENRKFMHFKKINLGKNGDVELLFFDDTPSTKNHNLRARSRSFPGESSEKDSERFHSSRDSRSEKRYTRFKIKLKCPDFNEAKRSCSSNI